MSRTQPKKTNSETAKKTLPQQKAKAKNKPVVAKLKTKKLEDRIAPGMVGGGLVDPGAAEGMDQPSDQVQTQDSSYTTELESGDMNGGDSSGESGRYVDDSSSGTNSDYSETESPSNSFGESMNQDYANFDNSYDAGTEPVDDAPSWREPDWVTANADGSVHVQPPMGVSVDAGIANFPMDVANESLPLPDGAEIQANGSVEVTLPESATFNPENNIVTLSADQFDPAAVPEQFTSFENPDGSWSVQLPEAGVTYDASANSLNFSNDLVNEIAPNNVEINENGTVDVTLPENTTVNADGSWDLPPGSSEYMDNPPPEYIQQMDFAEVQSDGSVQFELPNGASVEDGVATFPHDMIDELPIPEHITINEDGSLDMTAPEGTEWNADTGVLSLPPGTMHDGDVPPGIDYTVSPEGAYNITLPEGIDYNASSGTIHFDNYWANEVAPESVQIQTDGSISCELPAQTEYHGGGEFTIPAEQSDFLQQSQPEYLSEAEFVEPQLDGGFNVTPPDGAVVVDGVMQVPYDVAVESLPIPEHITLNSDGTLDVQTPPGTIYSEEYNSLTFPTGSIHLNDIPEGIDAYVTESGSITAVLPEGIEYNNGVCHFDNYWSNELAPPAVEIHTDGSVNVTLPQQADYQADGSFTLPPENSDFVTNPEPSYVSGAEWITTHESGAVSFDVPEHFDVQPETGVVSFSVEDINSQFSDQIPENITLNTDGTMDVALPEGSTYNAEYGVVSMPADSVNINELPPEIGAYTAPDGSICVTLPPGMEYDSGSVHCNNYWTNELAPENVQIHSDGAVDLQLPSTTQFHSDGSFTVPEGQSDFINQPEPAYVSAGPDWVHSEPNGAVTFSPPSDIILNTEAHTMTMPIEAVGEHFSSYVPEGVSFESNGTMNVPLPEGSTYNEGQNAVTIPPGTMSPSQLPQGIDYTLADSGAMTIQLPDGITYDGGNCHFDNYWTNELTPPSVAISPSGELTVQLPQETHYHESGSFSVPPSHADFVDHPVPDYVNEGPEWVEYQPTGSVSFYPPESIEVNPASGLMEMNVEAMNTHFENYLPHEATFHPDGTMEMQVPEGTQYNATANTLTFPEGTVHAQDIPPGISFVENTNGGLTVTLPEGIEYQNGSCHFDNHWTNEMLPPHVEIQPDGNVEVQLPSNTVYGADGGFSLPAESANFMDHPEPPYVSGGPDWAVSNPDGSVMFTPPPGEMQFDANAGTVTMDIEGMNEHFDGAIPNDVTFNPDGTMDVQLPEGTQFSNGTITFPSGVMNVNEIPEQLNPVVQPDGSIAVALPQGISFDPATGSVHCDNHWTNEFTPEHMEFQPNGEVTMNLPESTQFYPQGVVIPADGSHFAAPDYQPNYYSPEHNTETKAA